MENFRFCYLESLDNKHITSFCLVRSTDLEASPHISSKVMENLNGNKFCRPTDQEECQLQYDEQMLDCRNLVRHCVVIYICKMFVSRHEKVKESGEN